MQVSHKTKNWAGEFQGGENDMGSLTEEYGICETLRVVSDWVANAAARNERDVME